jgi:hypothetical protein
MTMLDDRARQAVDAIDRSVADYRPPAAGFAAAQRRHAMWAGAGWALAGSGAAAAVVVAAMFTPSPDPDVATTLPESTVITTEAPITETTVKPSPEPEALPPPVIEPTTTEAPVTTEAPTTTLDATPPELSITSPADGDHFEENVVSFSGKTEPGATVVAGGKWEASVTEEGQWSIQLVLSAGANGASFVATDAAGNETSARITVHYDPPTPPTTEPPGEGVEFTANATFNSCSENPPYDIYYGTADPETKVTISSAYGSGTVYANGEGNWSKKVFFPEAPYGETFVVTVKDHTGKKKSFEFVSYAEG